METVRRGSTGMGDMGSSEGGGGSIISGISLYLLVFTSFTQYLLDQNSRWRYIKVEAHKFQKFINLNFF